MRTGAVWPGESVVKRSAMLVEAWTGAWVEAVEGHTTPLPEVTYYHEHGNVFVFYSPVEKDSLIAVVWHSSGFAN